MAAFGIAPERGHFALETFASRLGSAIDPVYHFKL